MKGHRIPLMLALLWGTIAVTACGGGGGGSGGDSGSDPDQTVGDGSGSDGTSDGSGSDGTTQPSVTTQVLDFRQEAGGDTPTDLAVADFDGDGRLDIAVSRAISTSDFSGPAVSVFYRDTSGGFSEKRDYDVGAESSDSPGPITAGDIDGDGQAEIGIAYSNSAALIDVASDRSISALDAFQSNSGDINRFKLADYTGDGSADVVIQDEVSVDDEIVRVVPTGQNGQIVSSDTQNLALPDDSLGGTVLDFVVAQRNGDTRPDLAVTSAQTALVSLDEAYISTFVQQSNGSLVVRDRNGDGVRDFNDRIGPFNFEDTITAGPPEREIAELGLGDIDGDGSANLVQLVGSVGSQRFVDVESGSSTTFEAGSTDFGRSIAVDDFNGSGPDDVAVAVTDADELSVHFADGGSGFQAPTTVAAGPLPIEIEAADFGTDDTAELVVLNRETDDGGQSGQVTILSDLDAL